MSDKPVHLTYNDSVARLAEKAEGIKQTGREQIRYSKAPLKDQDSSDAWNERQNRLANARMGVDFLMQGIMMANKLKNLPNED